MEKRTSLEGFEVIRVLGDRPAAKQLAILGRFNGSQESAVVLATQKHMSSDNAQLLLSKETKLAPQFENDIYSKYDASLPKDLATMTIDLIYPATDLHIKKHTDQEHIMVKESPLDYQKCTLQYINSIPVERTQWVRNILEGKAEADRILLQVCDPQDGFVLLPDLKWDQKSMENMYCVAISKRGDIRSLRDLDASHITFLKQLRDQGCQAILSEFGIPKEQVKVFVHYPPSYFHFHVHFTHIKWEGAGLSVGKAHLLDDIIENLEFTNGEHYKVRSLSYMLGKDSDHWKMFEEHWGNVS